jgi:hypothetical protein
MPTIITNLTVPELFSRAVDNARKATTEIDRLLATPLDASVSETVTDRALRVAGHARVLAEAFSIIDSLTQGLVEDTIEDVACGCSSCSPHEREPNAPVPPHMN